MAMTQDYYDILGLKKGAKADEIKKAYRNLAKRYHPDSNAGNAQAEQKFKEISEAYSVLSDPEKKKLYDQFGHAAFSQDGAPKEGFHGSFGSGFDNGFHGGFGSGFSRSYSSGPDSYTEYHFESDGMDDFLHSFFDGFSPHSDSEKGSDLTADISVSLEEAALGCDKIIRLKNPQTGQEESLQVHIPAGIESGMSIRLRGKGMPRTSGRAAGDLLLSVTVLAKPGYERNGMDIYTSIRIPFTTAVFGGEALVSTLYGNVLCKIQPGTQSGTRIKLRGKGIISLKNASVHGDQYVTVQIDVPRSLSRDAAEKLKAYEQACQASGSETFGHRSGGSGKTTAA